MKYPTTRFVFDRKKTATKNKDALIQVEILLGNKKKYISTGVRVYKEQWSDKNHIIKRNDMLSLNDRIESVKKNIDGYINGLIENSTAFEWVEFQRFIDLQNNKREEETFLEYMERRIEERKDISIGTKRNHVKVLNVLKLYNGIVTFKELTKQNILSFYEWLQKRKITKIASDGTQIKQPMAQQTISSYIKCLNVYIHDALSHEIISNNPTINLKIKRGESEPDRWLSEEDVAKIIKTPMPTGSLQRVKDRFLIQVYTGLSFVDLMDLDISKIETTRTGSVIVGNRIKTKEPYIIAVLPEIEEILKKYDYKLPPISNEQYNIRLKVMAEMCGIKKRLASHWARRTFACLMINRGVRAETLAQIMGHSDTRTTLEFYAKMKKETVVSEMTTAMKKKVRK